MSAAPAIPDEQAALLAAIIAEPDDDAPRLVYADWLQEHGDEEQAQFIRDSVAAALLPTKADRQAADERLRAIDDAKRQGWMAALGVRAGTWAAIRGFTDGALFWDAESFFAEGPMVFARLPIRELVIWQREPQPPDEAALVRIAAMPELARLHTLRLSTGEQPMPTEGFARLIESPHLRGLRELTLAQAGLTDEHEHALAGAELPALEELDLSANALTIAGALAVLRSPRLPGVRRLDLRDNAGIGPADNPELYKTLLSELTDRFGDAVLIGLSAWRGE